MMIGCCFTFRIFHRLLFKVILSRGTLTWIYPFCTFRPTHCRWSATFSLLALAVSLPCLSFHFLVLSGLFIARAMVFRGLLYPKTLLLYTPYSSLDESTNTLFRIFYTWPQRHTIHKEIYIKRYTLREIHKETCIKRCIYEGIYKEVYIKRYT